MRFFRTQLLTSLVALPLLCDAFFKKKPPPPAPPPPPPASVLDNLKPFLLADSELWYACIFGYCLAVALLVRKTNKDINWYKGAVLATLMAYGGGTLVPILCGVPGVLVNEVAVPMMMLAWTLVSLTPIYDLCRTLPMVVLLSFTYEIFRCTVMMNCAAMAIANLKAPKAYPVATVGPLLCGMLGGVGGGFMPMSVGLDPLTKGLNWRIRSAFFFSVWMRLLLDPTTSPYLVSVLPDLADPAAGRALGVAIVAVLPLMSVAVPSFQPFGLNPLVALATEAKAKTA